MEANAGPEKNEDKIWYEFFEKMKADDPTTFSIIDDLITQFVEDYPRTSNSLDVGTLQAVLKEIQ